MNNPYENMILAMRHQGKMVSPGMIELAEMTGADTAKIGDFALMKEDLYIPDRLLSTVCTKVSGSCPGSGGALSDQSTYSQALKAGDTVLIYKLSDTKYAILERVVTA